MLIDVDPVSHLSINSLYQVKRGDVIIEVNGHLAILFSGMA